MRRRPAYERLMARGAGFPVRAPRPAGGRRSSQAQPSPRSRAGTRWSRDAGRQACGPEQGTAGALAPARPGSVRRTRYGREAGAPRSYARAQADARSAASRPRIPAGGWRRWAGPRGSREAAAARPEGARARPTCRDRSPVAAVPADFLDELLQAHGGLALKGRSGSLDPRRREPALEHAAGHQFVIGQVSPQPRRPDLGYDALAIHHQDGLAGGCQADIFAELVLQNLQANGSHERKVAPGSFLGQRYAKLILAHADEVIE